MLQNTFFESREDDRPRCVARYQGCTKFAAARMPCTIEGTDAWLCVSCMARWRMFVQLDDSLAVRCPRCAQHQFTEAGSADPAAARPLPLAGVAAVAIDDALRKEGITEDVRRRVLLRLGEEAHWLGLVRPDDPHEGVADEGSLRERAPA